MTLFIIITLVSAIICAIFTGKLAQTKGYESDGWQTAGFLFGPLALIAMAGMPDMKTRRYIRAIAEQQGVTPEVLDPAQAKTEWRSVAEAANSASEDYETVVALYKSEGGTQEPDFSRSNILARTITLKNASGQTLAYFSQRGDNLWHVVNISN